MNLRSIERSIHNFQGFKIHAAIECHPDLIEKTTLTFKKGPARRVKVVCISFDEVRHKWNIKRYHVGCSFFEPYLYEFGAETG